MKGVTICLKKEEDRGCRRPMPESLKEEQDNVVPLSVLIANFTAKESLK